MRAEISTGSAMFLDFHSQRAMHCPCVFAGTFAHDCWHCAATLTRACDDKKPQALVALAIRSINVTRHTDIRSRYHAR